MSNRLQKRAVHSTARRQQHMLKYRPGGVIESLEGRLLLAAQPLRAISGHIFNDLNGNGTRQPKEHWLVGVGVYVDLNANGVFDAGEPATATNKLGAFTFRKLPRGTYQVIAIAPTGDAATLPAGAVATANATKHSVTNMRFGMRADSSPSGPSGPDTAPPVGALSTAPITSAGVTPYRFTVTWTDDTAVAVNSFGDGNIIVSGPSGYDQAAGLVALDATSDGSPRTATYQIAAPAQGWDVSADGTYTVTLVAGQVLDTLGNADPAATLGTFAVEIPAGAAGAPALVGGINNVTALNNSSIAAKLSFNVANTVAGSTLSLDVDGVALPPIAAQDGSTLLSTDGVTTLVDGLHQFAVTQTMGNGVESTSAPTSVTVDTAGPTDQLTANALTAAGTSSYTFAVAYTDATAVSAATLSGKNLIITAPSTQQLQPTLLSLNATGDGPTRVATYAVAAPGGTWTGSANGSYTVTLQTNSVFDEVHNAAAGRIIGTFAVSIGQSLSAATGAPVLAAGSDTGTYSDDDVTNLNNSSAARSLKFSVPGTTAGAAVTLFSDGTPIGSATATSGNTLISTNGTVKLARGIHLITATQTTPGHGASNASTALGIVVDTQAPTASCSAASVNTFGATSYTFSVVYQDDISVDVSHITTGDVIVTGPNSFSEVATLLSVNAHTSGSPRMATYSITPPGGSWQAGGNGTYAIAMQAGQIADTAGNTTPAGAIATFTVNAGVPTSPIPATPTLASASDAGVSSTDGLTNLNNASSATTLSFNVGGAVAGATVTVYADGVPIGAAVAGGASVVVTTTGTVPLADGPHAITARQQSPGAGQSADSSGSTFTIDTAAPTIAGVSAVAVSAAGATSYNFSVAYVDATAVDVSRLGNGDITVITPGGATLTSTFISASPTTDSPSVTATYQFTPPGGSWTADDNGVYTLDLGVNQLHDTAGNTTPSGAAGAFSVNIPQPATAAPTTVGLAAASDSGLSSTDNLTNLNNSSTSAELQFDVSGTVAGATVTVYVDGAPAGAAVASGSLTVVSTAGVATLADGAHNITARQQSPGQPLSGVSPGLSITIDTTAPAASAALSDLTSPGGSNYSFAVTYTDLVGVDPSTFDNNDIVVSGPNGYFANAALVSIDNTNPGSPRTATYVILPPDGAWSPADDGVYTVVLQSNQVFDIAGNPAAGAMLGSFNVTL